MSDHGKLREAIYKARECFRFSVDEQKLTRPYRDEVREAIGLICEVAASTLPKTKMVEVWHCEWFEGDKPYVKAFWGESRARSWAAGFDDTVSCIRVTGPHQQEVPA